MDPKVAKFTNSFEWAVVRLTTLQLERKKPGRLLFASITFLLPDRPIPPKMKGIDRESIKKTGATVYFRRVLMKVDEALSWYTSLETTCRTPTPSRPEDLEPDYDGKELLVSPLQNDPQWPNLGLPSMGANIFSFSSEGNDPAPFVGSISSRIHRRFGQCSGVEYLLSNAEALLFVERRVHIDLKRYPEYLGSAVLVVPNPIIKQIDNFLIPASGNEGERVFYRFIPQKGQSLKGLSITMFDEGANLLTNFETKAIGEDGILDVYKGDCTGTYGYIITHSDHGILNYHPPAGFIRRICFNMGIAGETQKIIVPSGESPSAPPLEYIVNRTMHSQESMIGEEEQQPSVRSRVARATNRREKEVLAEKFGQRWFGTGDRASAMKFIHQLIGNARKRVIIADPYFGVLQVPQFLFSVRYCDIKIEILTSRLAFESTFFSDDEEGVTTNGLTEKLDKFSKCIEQLKESGCSNVVVNVLPGKKPELHDRFLVIDETVWFLGNSLNTLGDRSSLIIKLPQPDEVLEELKAMHSRADAFSEYKKRKDQLARKEQK
jgi:hypothetical protein